MREVVAIPITLPCRQTAGLRELRRDEHDGHRIRVHTAPARILGEDVGGAAEYTALDE